MREGEKRNGRKEEIGLIATKNPEIITFPTEAFENIKISSSLLKNSVAMKFQCFMKNRCVC